jgi:hypothetical protein
MTPKRWQYVCSHSAGIAAVFLTIGHVIAGEYQAALESAAIAAAAWGLNLKPMLPLPEKTK